MRNPSAELLLRVSTKYQPYMSWFVTNQLDSSFCQSCFGRDSAKLSLAWRAKVGVALSCALLCLASLIIIPCRPLDLISSKQASKATTPSRRSSTSHQNEAVHAKKGQLFSHHQGVSGVYPRHEGMMSFYKARGQTSFRWGQWHH